MNTPLTFNLFKNQAITANYADCEIILGDGINNLNDFNQLIAGGALTFGGATLIKLQVWFSFDKQLWLPEMNAQAGQPDPASITETPAEHLYTSSVFSLALPVGVPYVKINAKVAGGTPGSSFISADAVASNK